MKYRIMSLGVKAFLKSSYQITQEESLQGGFTKPPGLAFTWKKLKVMRMANNEQFYYNVTVL